MLCNPLCNFDSRRRLSRLESVRRMIESETPVAVGAFGHPPPGAGGSGVVRDGRG